MCHVPKYPHETTCLPGVTRDHYTLSGNMSHACLEETRKLIFNYIYQKELIKKVKVLIDLKPYYGKYKGTDTIPCEQSNVVYLSIVDKCADTNEPMHGGGIV